MSEPDDCTPEYHAYCEGVCEGKAERGKLTAENAALRAQVERLEDVVGRAEWVYLGNGMPRLCPVCLYAKSQGHHPGCQLAAVLRETEVDTETGRE